MLDVGRAGCYRGTHALHKYLINAANCSPYRITVPSIWEAQEGRVTSNSPTIQGDTPATAGAAGGGSTPDSLVAYVQAMYGKHMGRACGGVPTLSEQFINVVYVCRIVMVQIIR